MVGDTNTALRLPDLTMIQLVSLGFGAVCVGMRRGGIQGAAVLAVALLGAAFPPTTAIGIAVVVFLTADLQAVVLFARQVNWSLLLRLLIPIVAGIAVAAVVGAYLPTTAFEWILLGLMVIAFAGMLYQKRRGVAAPPNAAVGPIAAGFGFLSGFTSMIGNLSSVFVAIFFAVVKSEKTVFIATTAWLFFLGNLIKLPIHLFVWRSLRGPEVWIALLCTPLVSVGIALGRRITRRMSERDYWNFVVIVVAVAILRYSVGVLSAAPR